MLSEYFDFFPPLSALLAFAGTSVLFVLARGPVHAQAGTAAFRYLFPALGATFVAFGLAVVFSDELATFRYLGGLFLIAVAFILTRRATALSTFDEPDAGNQIRPGRGDVVPFFFALGLLPHLVEDPILMGSVGLYGSMIALFLISLTLQAATPRTTNAQHPLLTQKRTRQAAGLLLGIVAVYLAWP